jgi:hypothetical protein
VQALAIKESKTADEFASEAVKRDLARRRIAHRKRTETKRHDGKIKKFKPR